tara:strand:+ start:15847 stop:17112 length:1266 start_codon:yes stop_codon:yes gene_type:complete
MSREYYRLQDLSGSYHFRNIVLNSKFKFFLVLSCIFFSIPCFSQDIDNFKSFNNQSNFKKQKVLKYIEYFSKTKRGRDFFNQAYKKKGLYQDSIYEIFNENNIPKEIIFVSMLESGFSPSIESSAGAVGLWQFMPSTAKIFGLRIDEWVDERRDVYHSTNAAVSYFKSLLKKFGTWELALAGYNCGDLNVKKAIEKYKTKDFWYLSKYTFPKQTKEYVPQIIALIHISENLRKYNFTNLIEEQYIKTKKVKVPKNMKISKIAMMIGMDEDELLELNLSLLKRKVPPNESYAVNIPIKKIDKLYSTLNIYNDERVISKYKIKKGDTLSKIAIEFNNTLNDLYELNNLDSSKIIRGEYLLVYLSNESFIKDGKFYLHIVKRGDSLYKISKIYDVPIKDLFEWNNLSGSKIVVGQEIRLVLKND